MSRTTVQKFRDMIFSTKYSKGLKSLENEGKLPSTTDLADAIGNTLASGVANVDNAIMRADGTGGKLQKSLATISDEGTIDIPSGQSYTINGVEVTEVDKVAMPTSGTSAPSSTPAYIGALYVNTAAQVIYFAKGTASSADWVKVN